MKKIRRFILLFIILGLITYCSKVEDDSRSDSLITVVDISATSTNGNQGTLMYSDVIYEYNIVNDVASIKFRNDFINSFEKPTFWNDVNMFRYRVTYTRPDNRNTPGVDVPYPFDEGFALTIPVNSEKSQTITIVRAAAKLEKPLSDLLHGDSEVVISTIAHLEFWGADLSGRKVYTHAYLEVLFANWSDE